MKTYPILYSLYELVEGNGFVARVKLNGTALATLEGQDEWWAYGVNPGAIAASGATIREAFASLQASFRGFLLDCASDAPDFQALRTEVERFFNETDPSTQREWEEAVQAVRAGATIPANLGTQSADLPRGVEVIEVGTTPSPDHGSVGGDVEVAA